MRRQHHKAIRCRRRFRLRVALALVDVNDLAIAIDVIDLERHYLQRAQTCTLGHAERRLGLETWSTIEKTFNFLLVQHHR
jgi:hypothetical protein